MSYLFSNCWVVRVFCIFLIQIFFIRYVLQIFHKIFSCSFSLHSVNNVFHKLEVFFILVKSDVLILSLFMVMIFYLKKSLPYLRSCRFSLRLSFRILKILCFTFWFMIHFELIYVQVGRSVSRVIYIFVCGCPAISALRRHSALILSLLLCQRSVGST